MFLFFSFCWRGWAQCAVINFSSPSLSCKNQTINVINTTVSSPSFEWDFCDGSILNTPVSSSSVLSLASQAFDLKMILENGIYYSFIVNFGNGRLIKLNYGSSIHNTPQVTDFGDFGVISQPLGLGFWEENNKKYALISTNPGNVFLLNFGSSITNTPSVSEITGLTGLGNNRQIKIIEESGQVFALLAGGSTNNLSILKFGSSILNAPTQVSIGVAGASLLIGIDHIRYCNKTFVLLSGYNSGLHLLNFGSSLLNVPAITQCSSLTSLLGMTIVKSKNNFYALISSQSQGIIRFDFGTDMNNSTPSATVLGKFSTITFALGFGVFKNKSKYYAAGINFDNNVLTILDFPKDCDVVDSYQDIVTPDQIAYSKPGNYSITLKIKSSVSEENVVSKDIVVQDIFAPNLIITTDNSCITGSNSFTGIEQSGMSLSNVKWGFGDTFTGTGQGASHQYSSVGLYAVTLSADAANGCSNQTSKSISIYNPPSANFMLPTTNPLCTNQQFTFTNTSTSDVGSTPTWEWLVDGSSVSTIKDLQYAFSIANAPTIKLRATIPGCTNESSQPLTSLLAGPQVDFSFSGYCENDNVIFTNKTTDPVTSYLWNFGDGQTSTSTNAQVLHSYATHGGYSASLQGNSANGCQNITAKSITIYTKPQADFALSLPPFSCNGSASQFNDLTPNPVDSNISLWSWNFNDANSSQNSSSDQNPKHVYATSGNYNVSLTTTTDFGCSSNIQKQINIAQAPVADFKNTPVCKDQAVNFTDVSGSNIKTWSWQMENTFYYIRNPTHIFTMPGTYNIDLVVTGNNNCISITNKKLTIPNPLVPDFSFQKNCAGQRTEFSDLTDGSIDTVIKRDWEFGNVGIGSGSPSIFTFASTGNFNVKMKVTAQSGCIYSVSKNVNITSAPIASFTATPDVGIPPLVVNFTNTSTNASTFSWAFHDAKSSVSQITSPSFTFQDPGEYVVDLIANNLLGCSNTISKIIKAILPVYDMAVTALTLEKNKDGSIKVVAHLKNEGNLTLQSFPITLDLSGFTSIREIVSVPLAASSTYNYVFSNEISNTSRLDFLCAAIEIENDNVTDNNRICASLDDKTFVYEPYPNPANNELHIDWIASDKDELKITLVDTMGKQVFLSKVESAGGLSSIKFQTETLNNGVYMLNLNSSTLKMVKKIAIAH